MKEVGAAESRDSSSRTFSEGFDRDWSLADLSARSRESWAVRVFGRASIHVVQLITQLILVRLLLPADFGVIAIVGAAIGVAGIFRDVGLSQATIRQRAITRAQVSNLFWINAGLGLVVTVIVMLLAGPLASFYDDPRVYGVAIALAVMSLVNSVSAQHFALMRRGLRFRELARIDFVSALLTGLVAVSLAWFGLSFWALAYSLIVGATVRGVLVWYACDFRPHVPRFDGSVQPMLSFGGAVMVFALLGCVTRNLPYVIIGRALGAAAAGLYGRAFVILQVLPAYVLEPLNDVATSALSRLAGDPADYREYYLRTVSSLMVFVAPAAVFGALQASPLVGVLMGPRWHESAAVLALLSPGLIPQALCYTSGWIYLSLGNTRRMMQWGIGGWSVLCLVMIAGVPWGLRGIAAGYSVGMCTLLWPCMTLAYQGTQITFIDLMRVVWRPVAAAALAALSLVPVLHSPVGWPDIVMLPVSAALFAGAYLVILVVGLRQHTILTSRWAGRPE